MTGEDEELEQARLPPSPYPWFVPEPEPKPKPPADDRAAYRGTDEPDGMHERPKASWRPEDDD